MPEQVVYLDDRRYPGPACHPPPAKVTGLPTQRELDAFPRMFTWGELKDIIQSGDLELLMRNKPMQSRYDEWMAGMKAEYGSTENYLRTARLPWASSSTQFGSDPEAEAAGTLAQAHVDITSPTTLPPGLAPSTVPAPARALDAISNVATPGRGGAATASGAATPSSAGFVSLASLKLVNGKLRKAKSKAAGSEGMSAGASGSVTPLQETRAGSISGSSAGSGPGGDDAGKQAHGDNAEENGADGDEEEEEAPVYLKYDLEKGLDTDKYAVLYNDWPYSIPYGVSHHCVWSRVPIAHPELVDYDPAAWARIESEGLGGFTGITPLRSFRIASPTSSSGLPSPPSEPAEPVDPSAGPSSSASETTAPAIAAEASALAPEILFTQDMVARQKYIGRIREKDWYAADIAYSGPEARRWAGVGYMAQGGQEIDKMVRGLWDERGWECLWFVNPPRLQSVPGFSHFHVFARRKTPQEIDASEAFWKED